MATREWWRYDTPEALRTREAGEWRRTVASQQFRRRAGIDDGEDFDTAIRRRLTANARNPLYDLPRREAAIDELAAPRGPSLPQADPPRPLRPHERAALEGVTDENQARGILQQVYAEPKPKRWHERALEGATDLLGGAGGIAEEVARRAPIIGPIVSGVGVGVELAKQSDRPRGAAFAATEQLLSGEPQTVVPALRAGARGFRDPGEYQGADLLSRARGGRGLLSDEDTMPFGLSQRDVAGGAADVLLDPLDIAAGGALGAFDLVRGATRGARGVAAAADARRLADRVVTPDDVSRMQRGLRGEVRAGGLSDETAAVGGRKPPKMPEARSMAIDVIDTRPDLFQARDVPEGQATDPRRVKSIVENFEPNRFDPIVVAKAPNSDRYVVVSGHHRLDAARQMGAEDVPVRVMEGDLNTPTGRKKLQNEAALGNFVQAENNVREAYRSFRVLQQNGMSPGDIARQVRAGHNTEAKVQAVLDMGSLGDTALERVVANPQFAPAASEIGSMVRRHGVSQEDAFALFDQVSRRAAESGSIPSQAAIRASMEKYAARLAQLRVNQGQLAGFEPSAFMSAIAEEMDLRSSIIKTRDSFKRNVNAVRKLGADTGQPEAAEQLAKLGETEIATLNARLVNLQDEIAGRFEGVERATPAAPNAREPKAPEPGAASPAAPGRSSSWEPAEVLRRADAAGIRLTPTERRVLTQGGDDEAQGIITRRVQSELARAEKRAAQPGADVDERASQRRARLRARKLEAPTPEPEPSTGDVLSDALSASVRALDTPVAKEAPLARGSLKSVNELLAQIRRGEDVDLARNELALRFGMEPDEIQQRVDFPDQEGPGLFDAPPAAQPRQEVRQQVPEAAQRRVAPAQADLEGFARMPERQPDATPAMQGDLGLGAGERPIEALPMFAQSEAVPQQAASAATSPRQADAIRGRELGRTPEMELPGQRGVTQRGEIPSSRGAGQGQFVVADEPVRMPEPSAPSAGVGRRVPLWEGKTTGQGIDSLTPPWMTEAGVGGGGATPPPAPPGGPRFPSGRAPGGPRDTPPTPPERVGGLSRREWRTDEHSARGPEFKPKYVMDAAERTPEARYRLVTTAKDNVTRAEDYYAQQGMRELAPGQRDAFLQVDAMDQPGNGRGHFMRSVMNNVVSTPGSKLSPHVWKAWAASGGVEADVLTRVFPWEHKALADAERLFGGTDRVNVRYKGPATWPRVFRRDGAMAVEEVPVAQILNPRGQPVVGTFKDLVEFPQDYDLTDVQREWLRRFNLGNLEVSDDLNRDYNLDIGAFRPEYRTEEELRSGLVGHLPNINANEDVIEALSGSLDIGLGSSGRLKERTFATARARLSFDPDFVPETDLQRLFVGLNRAKARAAGNETFRAGVGGSIEPIQGLTRTATGTHLSLEDAKAVTNLTKTLSSSSPAGKIVRAISNVNQAVLSGDLSMFTIQGTLGFLASPVESARIAAGGARRALREGNLARPFSLDALADDIANDPSWADFAQFRGIPLASDVPEEFAGGYLRRIPGYSKLNEAGYIAVTRQQKGLWDRMTRDLVDSRAMNIDEARAVAMDLVTGFIPTLNPKGQGVSQARAALERAPFTSISFLRRPAAFAETAARGLMKMGTLQQVTPQEQLAAKLALQMAGTAIGVSLSTGMADALIRGQDPEQRAKDLLNPLSGEFLTVYAPGTGWKVPLGGPFRALIKAMVPRPVAVAGLSQPVPIPFAGLPKYLQGRIQPTVARALELRANKDYAGDAIMTGDFPLNAIQGAMHMAGGFIPIAATGPLEAARKGESFGRGVARTFGAFAGTNPIPPGFAEEKSRAENALAKSAKLQNVISGEGVATTWDQLTPEQRLEARKLRPELAAKLQNVQDRIDAKFDPEGRATRDEAEATRLTGEATLNRMLQKEGLPLSKFTEALELLQHDAAVKKAATYENVPPSDNPLDQALAGWYETYRLASYPGGIDFDKLDAIQADFMAGLTVEQQRYVEGRADAQHHPDVQWFYDNKKIIKDSGYYDVAPKLYDTLAQRVEANGQAPLPATYGEAIREVNRLKAARDIEGARQLEAIINLVDRGADRQKISLRAKNPALELALQENRGVKPRGSFLGPPTRTRAGGSGSRATGTRVTAR